MVEHDPRESNGGRPQGAGGPAVSLESLALVARKARPHYHRCLTEFYRPASRDQGLGHLGELFRWLQASLGGGELAELFRLAGDCAVGLQQGRLAADGAARPLLGKLDGVFKPLIATPPIRPDATIRELTEELRAELGRAAGAQAAWLPDVVANREPVAEVPSVVPAPDSQLLMHPSEAEGNWGEDSLIIDLGRGPGVAWSEQLAMPESIFRVQTVAPGNADDSASLLSADGFSDLLADTSVAAALGVPLGPPPGAPVPAAGAGASGSRPAPPPGPPGPLGLDPLPDPLSERRQASPTPPPAPVAPLQPPAGAPLPGAIPSAPAGLPAGLGPAPSSEALPSLFPEAAASNNGGGGSEALDGLFDQPVEPFPELFSVGPVETAASGSPKGAGGAPSQPGGAGAGTAGT